MVRRGCPSRGWESSNAWSSLLRDWESPILNNGEHLIPSNASSVGGLDYHGGQQRSLKYKTDVTVDRECISPSRLAVKEKYLGFLVKHSIHCPVYLGSVA